MTTRYSFVYFDLDDTLLDHGAAERSALADLHSERFADGPARATLTVQSLQHDYHVGNVKLWRRYSLAEISADELRHDRFKLLCTKYELEDNPLSLSDRYMELYANHWRPIPGAMEAFGTIADSTRVGIITNGFAITQHEKLNRFSELRQKSEAIVISEEFGHMKPSKKLFDHASVQARCPGDEILYVGDSWQSDVEGGLGAGWNVAWFASSEKISAISPEESSARLTCFSDWSELVTHCAETG
jgi:5'-nucleotidase